MTFVRREEVAGPNFKLTILTKLLACVMLARDHNYSNTLHANFIKNPLQHILVSVHFKGLVRFVIDYIIPHVSFGDHIRHRLKVTDCLKMKSQELPLKTVVEDFN